MLKITYRTIRKASVVLASILVIALSCTSSIADVLVPLERGNKLLANVNVVVTRNNTTGLYKYSYTVTNDSNSLQSATNFMIEILADTTVVNPTSPTGWEFSPNPDMPYVSWFAAGIDAADIPADWDGEVLPSSYVIAPGEALSGFSFESIAGPQESQFYVQGWTPMPVVTGDLDELVEAGYNLNDRSPFVASRSQGMAPMVLNVYSGNRRPATDGFVGYLNIGDRETRSAPTLIVGMFSLAGETVYPETIRAELNGVNITHLISPDSTYGGDFIINLTTENSNIVVGRNTLTVSVDGVVPNNGNTGTDADRITFFVE